MFRKVSMKDKKSCPVCMTYEFDDLLIRNSIPVHQNWPASTREDAINTPKGELHLVNCRNCGFISNIEFDIEKLAYGKGYENAQNYSAYFEKYLLGLADYLIKEKNVRNSTILEIGCGNGFFLKQLVSDPQNNNFGIGFDPSYDGPKDLERMHIVNDYFNGQHIDYSIDVVISRHVIQHISQPVLFLKKIHDLLQVNPKATIFIETPNIEWSIKNRTIWDYTFEQCSYFSKDTLSLALNNAGFEVLKIQEVFGGLYLWAEATPLSDKMIQKKSTDRKLQSNNFARELEEELNHWKKRIDELSKKGNVCFWGAGAKGATLANIIDPECTKINCVIDVNPKKWNKYITGTGHLIISPEMLKDRKIDFAIVMNPNYISEIKSFVENNGLNINLIM